LNQYINMSMRKQSKPVRTRLQAFMDAATAAKALGVSRGTLYAYVSRGLVRSTPHPSLAKASLYVAADVQALITRKARMRRPHAAAASALEGGLPVLKTRITHFEGDRLFYRSREAISFSREASLEDAARLLWDAGDVNPFAGTRFDPRMVPGWSEISARFSPPHTLDRACTLLPLLAAREPPSAGKPGAQTFAAAARLVHAVVAAIAGIGRPLDGSMHDEIAIAWRKPKAADAIRRALVLLADHELNASTFTVRVIASTSARLTHCVIGGLAAVSGPRHGGGSDRVRDLLDGLKTAGDAERAVGARLQRGETVPGFGHTFYRDEDPRAVELLSIVKPDEVMAAVLEATRAMAGLEPNIDFALLVLERRFELPTGAAMALFAMGRTVGWLAHAFEQRASGTLIRPRAEFVLE
jgi:citrate synthase